MRGKQNRKMRQDVPTPSAALRAIEALEQQVRSHPVVQEVVRLFDARIVSITLPGTSEVAERLRVEQQALCFSTEV